MGRPNPFRSDIPEIQRARFQRAHHLQALQRFPPERDGLAGQQFVQQAQPGGRQDVQADVPEQVQRLHAPLREIQFQEHLLHPAEFPAHIADELGEIADQFAVLVGGGLLGPGDDRSEHEVQQRPALQVRLRDVIFGIPLDGLDHGLFLRSQDGAEQAVRKDGPDLAVVKVPAAGLFPQALLHQGDGRHEGIDGTARERAPHRHIDVGMLRRDGVQQGHQEILVGQDESRFHRIPGIAAGQDLGGELRLSHGGRHVHDMEGGLSEAFRIHRERIREIPDILPHEDGRLVPGVPYGIGDEIPAELRQTGVAEAAQDRLLALVQGVQAHEHEPLRVREHGRQDVGDGLASFQAFGQVAVHHPLIGHSLRPEAPAEVLIKRKEDVPDLEETGLHGGVVRIQTDGQPAVPVAEMVHEMQDGLPLDFRQVAVVVLDILEIRHVGEQVLRVHEELVHVAEVREDHLAPEDELVQGLGLRVYRPVGFVQFQQQADAVGHLTALDLVEEIVDGQGLGRQHGPVRAALPQEVAEVLPEEHGRPPVRENEAGPFDIRREIMGRDLFEEWYHTAKKYSLSAKILHKGVKSFQSYIFSDAVANDADYSYLCK